VSGIAGFAIGFAAMRPLLRGCAIRSRSETDADPALGGSKLNETVRFAQQALDAFGTPELRKLIGPVRRGGNLPVLLPAQGNRSSSRHHRPPRPLPR